MSIHGITSLEALQQGPLEEGGYLAGKRVFVRVDFNVPLQGGTISDDSRIVASLPTIQFALEAGAKVIVASHLGRPKGPTPKLSLEPCGTRLAELTGCEVLLPEDCIGDAPKKVIHDLRVAAAGGGGRVTPQICLLENLRFHAGEEQDDESFARALGELCDVYVDDAFGAMHRAHASVHGLPRLKEDRGAGFLVMREIEALEKLVKSPARPYAALLGGVKVSDKIDVIEALLGRCDRICIGGAMANTFLAAEGHNMQRSLVEQDKLPLARTLISKAEQAGVALLLPNDVVVGESLEAKIGQAVAVHEIPDGTMALDIGPDTVSRFGKALSDARTIFWNGPMGVFESAAFSKGTFGMARLLSGVRGFTVVGGGDSAAAVHQAGGDLADKFDHISTGGGASLTFIEGKRMPGIEALRHRTIDDDR